MFSNWHTPALEAQLPENKAGAMGWAEALTLVANAVHRRLRPGPVWLDGRGVLTLLGMPLPKFATIGGVERKTPVT